MTEQIQPLPTEVINLIAAGEVVDSMAAVVRELVENALDAQATRIVLSLEPDLWRVQVADDGAGMDLSNLRLCALPHSTSKIHNSNDLWKITSLGFRGEALHSLAQLSELEILSRPAMEEEGVGWRIQYSQQGKPTEENVAAIAPGTIVTIFNLFGTVPVRRQGLPGMAQQLRSVQEIVQQIALCHPQVTWQAWQNQRPWFSISPGETAQQILPQILRQVQQSDLQQLSLAVELPEELGTGKQKATDFPAQLKLLVGLPDRCHRRRSDWVRVAINGRFVRSPELEQTILGAFARTLPRDRYPVCLIHLQVCPSQIDWNRHPAKTEVYLHNLDFWRQQVSQGIERAFSLSNAQFPSGKYNQKISQLLKASEEKADYHAEKKILPKQEETSKNEINFMALKAVGQINKTYIIAEHSTGLWLIEQHIAHERVLYEQLLTDWRLVPLQKPVILSQLKQVQLSQLEDLGLDVEPFGEDLWAIRNIPAMLEKREDCTAALLELSQGGSLQEAQVATACRSAIRNGTPLNLKEMQQLLDSWKNTHNPRTCPHGRPIYLSLEESSLARFFRRHWVIGKSHGI
ncbi:MAG: DNA mismatch repair endonuclease MutL [Spirulinaceae cyanobacterium]